MDGMSPYQPPHVPVLPPGLPSGEPPVVKVFGIIHLVFAGIGVVTALFGLATALLGNPFLKLAGDSPEMRAHLESQIAMQERMMPATIATSILSFLVAIPMVVAGIKLLRKRRDCLKWSNIYAISPLGAKAVNLVLGILVITPAMNEGMREMIKGPGGEQAAQMASGFTAVGGILAVLFTCVYPVLSLILLNRPPVKQWASTLP